MTASQNGRYGLLHLALRELGHPDRLLILTTVEAQVSSPKQIADLSDSPLGSIAYHVRTMCEDGLLELAHEGRVRGAVQHFYRLSRRGRRLHAELMGA